MEIITDPDNQNQAIERWVFGYFRVTRSQFNDGSRESF